jgi:hypothetical protein
MVKFIARELRKKDDAALQAELKEVRRESEREREKKSRNFDEKKNNFLLFFCFAFCL